MEAWYPPKESRIEVNQNVYSDTVYLRSVALYVRTSFPKGRMQYVCLKDSKTYTKAGTGVSTSERPAPWGIQELFLHAYESDLGSYELKRKSLSRHIHIEDVVGLQVIIGADPRDG